MSGIEKSNLETFAAKPPTVMAWIGRVREWSSSRREGFAPIFNRVLLLFGILCAVKITMFVGLRRHLYEVHWRVDGQPFSWVNHAVFYSLVALTTLNIWHFSRRCRAMGSSSVRNANGLVIALAAVFILMTLHVGDKNYLSPIMTGILSIPSLGWYLVCDFFFRPPYLAAWILAYGIVYAILVVTKRKDLALNVTALFAGIYGVVALRDWMNFRDALIVVNCFALVSLASLWRPAGTEIGNLAWIAGLLAGTVFVFATFTGWNTLWFLGKMNPVFLVISGSVVVVLAGASVLAYRLGFWRPWCGMLPFVFAGFFLLINVNFDGSANYNHLLRIGFTLPRYFLGELFVSACATALGILYRCWKPRGGLIWFDLGCLLLVAWSLADLRLTQVMGARLDWMALSLAWGETPQMMWRMAAPYLPLVVGVLTIVTIIYAAALWFMRRVVDLDQQTGPDMETQGSLSMGVAAFLLIGLVGNWLIDRDKANGQSLVVLAKSSPLWERATYPVMDKTNFIATAQQLGMTELLEKPVATHPAPRRDLNVVLIFQESTYNKYLSLFGGTEGTQPLLSEYKDRMELFPNFYSSFPGSIHARFAAFTGLYPVLNFHAFTFHRVPVKSIFEVLHENGYRSSLFYSSFFDYTGFRDFLKGRGIDEMYDADTMPGAQKSRRVSWGLHEDETLGAIQNRIRQYAAEGDKFFLTYIPAAPHNPFDGAPARFRKHRKEYLNDFTPAYLNELLHMDWVIASICDQLKESGLLTNTLVVITSDHGELLGANGGPIGHGWAVDPEMANIPLIIMDPSSPGFRINPGIGSHVDLLPTIAKRLGISLPQGQLYQGRSMRDGHTNRVIYLSSFQQYGIIEGTQMLCGERGVSRLNDALNIHPLTNRLGNSVLSQIEEEGDRVRRIQMFDSFQENFLRNYSYYCEMLQTPD